MVSKLKDASPDTSQFPRHTLFSNNYFIVAPSKESIDSGHFLICPSPAFVRSTRARSIHDMISSTQSVHEYLTEAINYVQTSVKSVCGQSPVFLEHGSHRSTLCPQRPIVLHAIPQIEVLARNFAETNRWLYESVVSHKNIGAFYLSRRGLGEYILISDNLDTMAVWSGEDRLFPDDLVLRIIVKASREI